jgi:hypothetical protein
MTDELVLVDWDYQREEMEIRPIILLEHKKNHWRQNVEVLGPDSDDDNADGNE